MHGNIECRVGIRVPELRCRDCRIARVFRTLSRSMGQSNLFGTSLGATYIPQAVRFGEVLGHLITLSDVGVLLL